MNWNLKIKQRYSAELESNKGILTFECCDSKEYRVKEFKISVCSDSQTKLPETVYWVDENGVLYNHDTENPFNDNISAPNQIDRFKLDSLQLC